MTHVSEARVEESIEWQIGRMSGKARAQRLAQAYAALKPKQRPRTQTLGSRVSTSCSFPPCARCFLRWLLPVLLRPACTEQNIARALVCQVHGLSVTLNKQHTLRLGEVLYGRPTRMLAVLHILLLTPRA